MLETIDDNNLSLLIFMDAQKETAIIDATLTLLGQIGWPATTLIAIAKQARLPTDEVVSRFPSIWEILEAFRERNDSCITAGSADSDTPVSLRDRLFDLTMERIEIISPWKAGINVIAKQAMVDPVMGIRLYLSLNRSMGNVLAHAGAKGHPCAQLLQSSGLTLIYLLVLRRWLADDSEDLGPTMAELNERLIVADRTVKQLCSPQQRHEHSS